MAHLKRIAKQHENTWADLHRRLISIPFDYKQLFPDIVYQFINLKAISVSSSVGYFVPCLLSTSAFVLGLNSLVSTGSQTSPCNLFVMVIGPPTTGKSQAMKECAVDPIMLLRDNCDIGNFMIERCTSSGLVKTLSEIRKAFVLTPELYDVLNKMLKNDEENATGEVQMLCELFSGEHTSFRFATEAIREIPENTPFGILGTTQVPFAVRILARLDQGHGLLDRFLINVPCCLRPSPEQTSRANSEVSRFPVPSFKEIFWEIHQNHLGKRTYTFSENAKKLLENLNADFIEQLNESLLEGTVGPKSKKSDLLQRLAVSLHVFNYTAAKLLRGRKPDATPTEVTLDTVKKALAFLEYSLSQKDVILDCIGSLSEEHTEKERKQPTIEDRKIAILKFSGPIVTYRGFRQAASRTVRVSTDVEFNAAVTDLESESYGKIVKLRTPRSSKETLLFLKCNPEGFQKESPLISHDEFASRYRLATHSSVTQGMKTMLIQKGHVAENFFQSAS